MIRYNIIFSSGKQAETRYGYVMNDWCGFQFHIQERRTRKARSGMGENRIKRKGDNFMGKKILTIFAILMVSLMAFSVDLINKDGKSYNIKIKSGASTTSTSISSNTTKSGVCSSCTIVVEGVGEISADGSDKIIIKDGKLTKK
jgi:hypothetical protein